MRHNRRNHPAPPANDDVDLGIGNPRAHDNVPDFGIDSTCKGEPSQLCVPEARKETPPARAVAQILTNLPERIPVLSGEIALLKTYWGAILDLMLANDNDAD